MLFADISGSTRLYDTLGDAQAKKLIDECMGIMRSVIAQYHGRVIKTIGDEIMCVLPDADSGHLTATDILLKVHELPVVANVKRAIRIGFHAGPVIEDSGDVFGDTVNMAARMTGLAKGMQIITTSATVERLSPALRESIRRISALSIKGKGEDVEVCEVLWQAGADVTMATASMVSTLREINLELTHGAKRFVLDAANSGIALGRDASCQVVLADRKASRVHARIERRRDKFFLVDQSSNGTYVTFAGESEMVLRREELILRGRGQIAFGHSIVESSGEIVKFSVLD
ncbi:MAG: guanylate cyclase [Betaproteobacteria bacterium RIFCSPLOWO2_12_FULL_63_13]|nr:MAG: guanylate cyclase [Betaproteobacteria bacterium RIFCSPLOWO2_12_FULL_63_13]